MRKCSSSLRYIRSSNAASCTHGTLTSKIILSWKIWLFPFHCKGHKEQKWISRKHISLKEKSMNMHMLYKKRKFIKKFKALACILFILVFSLQLYDCYKELWLKKKKSLQWAYGCLLKSWLWLQELSLTRLCIKIKSRPAFLDSDLLSTHTSCWPSDHPFSWPLVKLFAKNIDCVLQRGRTFQLIRRSRGFNQDVSSLSLQGFFF